MKRWILGICILLCVLLWCVPAAAEEAAAEDYTRSCRIVIGDGKEKTTKLLDKNVDSALKIAAGTTVSVSWDDKVKADRLCLQWKELREGITVTEFDAEGTELGASVLPMLPENICPLAEQTRSVVISGGESEMLLSCVRVYGAGELPDPFHEWIETPKNLDYLLISTHPDDDVLFMGSVIPIYGAERGYTGTIAYVTCGKRVRMSEAQNGAWAMGLRYRPLFWGFPDVGMDADKKRKATFVYDEVLLKTVQTYREYRPLVVFAQDENGEYGHWQHVLTSKAAVEAFTLAADPSYDPASAEAFGIWQVQKLYLHLYRENEIILPPNEPLSAFDGKTAWQVAKIAYQKHESQQHLGFKVHRYGDARNPFNQFGMILGAVKAGNDIFANIGDSLLAANVTPTPSPTPEPTLTPEPTPTIAPTPEPTPTTEPTPSPAPTAPPAEPTVTETPVETAGPEAAKEFRFPAWGLFAIAGVLAIGAGILIAAGLRGRKKQGQ